MLKMLWFLLLAIASVWLGIIISKDPGYVLIALQQWTVEMPLWLAGIGILLLFVLLNILWGLIKTLVSLNESIRNLFARRRRNRSRLHTTLGLQAYLETRWSEAETQLVKGASSADKPGVNFLFAAIAADKQKAHTKRDDYLQRATLQPELQLAVAVQEAHFAMEEANWKSAVDTLKKSGNIDPYDRIVLRILKTCYEHLEDWHALLGLLPAIRNLGLLPYEEYQQLSIRVYQELLQHCGRTQNLATLTELWNHIPRATRKDPELITTYVIELQKFGANEPALEFAQNTLKKQWCEPLAAHFGELKNPHPEKALAMMESWLQDYPNNPTLLNTLGHLAEQAKLWGKARTFFESSLQLHPSLHTAVSLAKLHDKMGDIIAAQTYYRKAAELGDEAK